MVDGEDIIKLFPNEKKPWEYSDSFITRWYKDKKGEYILTDDGLSWPLSPERKPLGQDRVENLKSSGSSLIFKINLYKNALLC